MTKKTKKKLSSIIAAFMLSTNVTGMIANAEYVDFEFHVNRSSTEYSDMAIKSVIHGVPDCAKIYPTTGLLATCPLGVTVVNYYGYSARSNTVWFNSLDAMFPQYTSPAPGAGAELCLKGTAGYYYTEAQGTWEP